MATSMAYCLQVGDKRILGLEFSSKLPDLLNRMGSKHKQVM
jgi:hypothetical protein